MVVAVTALDVALVSSIAALTAAAITPVVTWIVADARNRHERWSRIYDDKRDAYVKVLESGYRSLEVLDNFLEAVDSDDPLGARVPPGPGEFEYQFQARVGLFARADIARQLGEFEERRLAALDGFRDPESLVTAEGRRQSLRAVNPIRLELEERMERIRRALYDDIAN
jgi:hypothetical protein